MAAKQEEWEEARLLYANGYSPREISKILLEKNIKLHYATIFKKAQKDSWFINADAVKKISSQKVDKLLGTLEKSKEFEIVSDQLMQSAQKRISLMQSMNDILKKALDLKNEILDKTAQDLRDKEISALTAAKTINNLGLGMANIAKMAGIKIEDEEIKKDVTDSMDDGPVKVYIPENNRNQNIILTNKEQKNVS